MKALTIWQPWASLIAAGAKPYEWRKWEAPRWLVGQRIAIHAGARPPKTDEIRDLILQLREEGSAGTSLVVEAALPLLERWITDPGSLPLSSILCTAIMGKPISALEYGQHSGVAAADSDRVDHQKWGWPLTDICLLEHIVPSKGRQGIWDWYGETMS